ncbi:MAG: NAD(+)/NADH kinase [Sorangiineae bacterium]|nr:NAD(+)/NADH kinase [Polyangiaceae bacterium]MEB2323561.1 NAD(+)/NADH kinase [Sorangiineae bacterium]
MTRPRVVVVAKRSSYARFIRDEADPRARALLRRHDPSVAHWREAHDEHTRTLDEVLRWLDERGARAVLVENSHAAFDTADAILVVAVGGDGTLLAASHNVGRVPILGVNSAPCHSVGFFCGAERRNLGEQLERALEGCLPSLSLSRMMVSVNGRIRSRRVLNEALFCHASPAATSRYILRHGAREEEQRSSGFWIGPAAGSTAASHSAGGKVLPLRSRKLQLVVREPYVPFGARYRLLRVVVELGREVSAQSKMNDACLFLDGPYKSVSVRLGDAVSFTLSDEPLSVLGLDPKRHRGPRSGGRGRGR